MEFKGIAKIPDKFKFIESTLALPMAISLKKKVKNDAH